MNKFKKIWEQLASAKFLKKLIIILGVFIVCLLIFQAGIVVGGRRADFAGKWGDNYHRNFAGPRQGFLGDFSNRDFVDANGAIGQIISFVGTSTPASGFIVRGRDNLEKVILVTEATVIKNQKQDLKLKDLKVDDLVVIMGAPDESGRLEAKLIRIIPTPPTPAQTKNSQNQNNFNKFLPKR